MEEIMIRAQSFSEARKLLAKRFHKVWIPIRIWESSIFRFVDIQEIKPQQNDIDYNNAEKKFNKSSNNKNNLLNN